MRQQWLWFGEGFDEVYDKLSEDFWLVEISGIPFGLMGEMMYRGMPLRGMLYGMTGRLGWGGDPQPIWRLWDLFGMAGAEMLGYWDPACPVRADREDVKVTVYQKPGETLLAVAGWNTIPVETRLSFDWQVLELDPDRVTLKFPAVENVQIAAQFSPMDSITIKPGEGLLLILANEAQESSADRRRTALRQRNPAGSDPENCKGITP